MVFQTWSTADYIRETVIVLYNYMIKKQLSCQSSYNNNSVTDIMVLAKNNSDICFTA